MKIKSEPLVMTSSGSKLEYLKFKPFAATSHNPGPLSSDATDYDVCAKAGFWCINFPN